MAGRSETHYEAKRYQTLSYLLQKNQITNVYLLPVLRVSVQHSFHILCDHALIGIELFAKARCIRKVHDHGYRNKAELGCSKNLVYYMTVMDSQEPGHIVALKLAQNLTFTQLI